MLQILIQQERKGYMAAMNSDAENWGNGRGGWQTIISAAPQLNHLDQKPVFWDERLYAEAWSVVSAVNFKNDEHVIPVYLP